MMTLRLRLVCLLAASLYPCGRADAQKDPRLQTVVRLAQDGYADSARATLGRILGSMQPADSGYAEALYTSALVAASDQERRLSLRKVIFDYAGSPWADDAILMLAQLEYSAANPAGTVRQVERIVTDYPTSPLIPIATFWGARAASDTKDPALACKWATLGLETVTDAELRGQLEFQKQRCLGLQTQLADSARRVAVAPPDTARPKPVERSPAPARKGPVYRVQIVAAKTKPQADEAVASLRRIGYDAVVTKEGGFLKVRAGAFPTQAQAQAALVKIRAALGGKPFIAIEK
ncbi:MAG: SPOR domain-containing protein [Gemmatimonadota bacterium]